MMNWPDNAGTRMYSSYEDGLANVRVMYYQMPMVLSALRSLATWITGKVARFLASSQVRDPHAKWRSSKPTAWQNFVIAEICSNLQLEPQAFDMRADAFTWIEKHGGNPRSWTESTRPDFASLAEAFK